MANEKSEAKLLQEKLYSQRKNGVLRMTEEQRSEEHTSELQSH